MDRLVENLFNLLNRPVKNGSMNLKTVGVDSIYIYNIYICLCIYIYICICICAYISCDISLFNCIYIYIYIHSKKVASNLNKWTIPMLKA